MFVTGCVIIVILRYRVNNDEPMSQKENKLQAEMDAILLKTMDSVKQVLDEQGKAAAQTLIELIAERIQEELLAGNVSKEYASMVHDLYINDMTQALFGEKH